MKARTIILTVLLFKWMEEQHHSTKQCDSYRGFSLVCLMAEVTRPGSVWPLASFSYYLSSPTASVLLGIGVSRRTVLENCVENCQAPSLSTVVSVPHVKLDFMFGRFSSLFSISVWWCLLLFSVPIPSAASASVRSSLLWLFQVHWSYIGAPASSLIIPLLWWVELPPAAKKQKSSPVQFQLKFGLKKHHHQECGGLAVAKSCCVGVTAA